MIFNYWSILCILEKKTRQYLKQLFSICWLWPALQRASAPSVSPHHFYACQPWLPNGLPESAQSEHEQVRSSRNYVPWDQLSANDWWEFMNKLPLPPFGSADLHCFPQFPVVTHWITHPLLTSGSSLSHLLLLYLGFLKLTLTRTTSQLFVSGSAGAIRKVWMSISDSGIGTLII